MTRNPLYERMAADPFESPKALIQRGREHVDTLQIEMASFWSRKPYARVIEFDVDTKENIHKFRLTTQIPGKIRTIAKDATSNLRDALDHAVYGAALLLGRVNPNNTGFPFARDAVGVRGELDCKRLSGNPPEIRPLLASFEPHEGGNELLFGLNSIRNPNTHRVLVPVMATSMATSGLINATINGGLKFGYSRWDATKNEVEFMRIGRDSHFECQINVASTITFGDIGILAGREVAGTLRQIAVEVEQTVLSIETEARRIKGL